MHHKINGHPASHICAAARSRRPPPGGSQSFSFWGRDSSRLTPERKAFPHLYRHRLLQADRRRGYLSCIHGSATAGPRMTAGLCIFCPCCKLLRAVLCGNIFFILSTFRPYKPPFFIFHSATQVKIATQFYRVAPFYFSVTRFPSHPQRRSVSEMEKAVFPLRKCTVFIFRKNRLRPPLWGSWGRAAPKSCGRRLETGGAFLASFFRRRKKEGYKEAAAHP